VSTIKWIQSPDYNYEPLLATYSKIEPPSQQSLTGRCIRWIHSPDTIEELIRIEDFLSILCSSIVFLHNRKPSVNELIFNKLSTAFDYYEVIHFTSSKFTFNDLKTGNWLSQRQTDKKPILIIDSVGSQTITDFVAQLSYEPFEPDYGIWIRGYVEELEKFIPSSFHALFLFDTSTQELDRLKKRIAISESMIELLRNRQTHFSYDESVIFFWNYEKEPSAPLLDMNPKILDIGQNINYSGNLFNKTGMWVEGGLSMDTYNISGQAGAVGPNAHAHDMNFTQIGSRMEETIDLSQLAEELSKLRQAMKDEATEAEHDIAVSDIAKAEKAANAKDSSKVAEYLKSAGKWALDIATKIGVAIAAEALKQAMGLK